MTLEESKKAKMMLIEGTFTAVPDLTELWFRLYHFGGIKLSGTIGRYSVRFRGTPHDGLYVLGVVVEAVRNAEGNCHLEVSCYYE